MIPEELHLRNFMSHRETDLDLRGVHLASLVGDNGAGKSSLLDAITWVVWGRSRSTHNRDDNLIYHGETSMEVEYVFRMPYQSGAEQRCRILRRREQRGKSVRTTLDLQMEDDTGWQTQTSGSVRETQARIIEALGLDYKTFINSAYLRQGNADEFTVQTPTERKRVLADILGLDRWPVYQDRAKNALSTAQGQLKEIDRRLDEINEDLAHQAEYEANLAQSQAAAEQAETAQRTLQEKIDELGRQEEQRDSVKRTLRSVDSQAQQETQRLQQLKKERNSHEKQLAGFNALLAKADDIEAQYQTYQQALEEEKHWNEKLAEAARLQSQQADLERRLNDARSDLERQVRKLEREQRDADNELSAAKQALTRELSSKQAKRSALQDRYVTESDRTALEINEKRLLEFDAQEQDRDAQRKQVQQNREAVTDLKAQNRSLKQNVNEEQERLNSLEQAEAQCPLCGRPLDDAHRDEILGDIQTHVAELNGILRANAAEVKKLDVERKAAEQAINSLERSLRERKEVTSRANRLRQRIEQDAEARAEVAVLDGECAALEQRIVVSDFAADARQRSVDLRLALQDAQTQLNADDYALDVRASLSEVNAQREAVGYDKTQHDQIKTKVRKQSGAEAAWRNLEKAEVSAQSEQAALDRVLRDLEVQSERCANLDAQKQELNSTLDSILVSLKDSKAIRRDFQQARTRAVQARQRVGAAEQNLAALATQATRQQALQEERNEVAQQVAIYAELRDAFGVNGIPAMIIEHTLPELERESNRVLQQLTGGRMHVRFETQRETKSGNLSETLDIIISDEKGTRPYETFSGGEQFRANFAVRVALSRLLAQRSGVRLRSLFVDEGFGALDADGRQRLTEAVKAVQSDFDMVLVITHVEELREAFPTQIRVTKTDSGSVVEVV